MKILSEFTKTIAEKLIANRQTISVSESSTGGLISAALLAVPGASAYYKGGAVIYTLESRKKFLSLSREDVKDLKPMTEPMALYFAKRTRETLNSDWAISELGIAGPTGSPYGANTGTCVIGISGPTESSIKIETGNADREANMWDFTERALDHLMKILR